MKCAKGSETLNQGRAVRTEKSNSTDLLGYVIDGRRVERIGRGEAKGDATDLGYDLENCVSF